MGTESLVPGSEQMPPEMAGLVMHASLQSGADLLMGSDDPNHQGVRGMVVNVSLDDPAEGKRIFDQLAEGGVVAMPLEDDVLVAALRHGHGPLRYPLDGEHRPRRGPHRLNLHALRRPAVLIGRAALGGANTVGG